jgi:hypothetical protein
LHAQPRAARAILSKRSDEWQLESVVVEPEARTAPEPRP